MEVRSNFDRVEIVHNAFPSNLKCVCCKKTIDLDSLFVLSCRHVYHFGCVPRIVDCTRCKNCLNLSELDKTRYAELKERIDPRHLNDEWWYSFADWTFFSSNHMDLSRSGTTMFSSSHSPDSTNHGEFFREIYRLAIPVEWRCSACQTEIEPRMFFFFSCGHYYHAYCAKRQIYLKTGSVDCRRCTRKPSEGDLKRLEKLPERVTEKPPGLPQSQASQLWTLLSRRPY